MSTSSNAWVLASICAADQGKGATLKDIIAAGDFLNHAIFTAGELRRGVAKLVHVGYVVERDGRFYLSGGALSLKRVNGRVSELMSSAKELLSAPEYAKVVADGPTEYPTITEPAVRVAHDGYMAEFKLVPRKT